MDLTSEFHCFHLILKTYGRGSESADFMGEMEISGHDFSCRLTSKTLLIILLKKTVNGTSRQKTVCRELSAGERKRQVLLNKNPGVRC